MKIISDEEIEIIRRCLKVRDTLSIYKILNGLSEAPIERPNEITK